MTAPAITAWAIKAPEWSALKGGIIPNSADSYRGDCISRFTDNQDWKYWYRRGYRCVKVHIAEAQE